MQHWSDGGLTEPDNLVLLCRYHHHLVHHGAWEIRMIDGRPWFTPPRWTDPGKDRSPAAPDCPQPGPTPHEMTPGPRRRSSHRPARAP
ncbi:HNH endonuclease signature motif containing protein [Actinomycetospora endophytica]|uniref:HNH endonuclease signature motif containing protein n=1 Tax=Actinomycetospora endophytica TaxID=2291215 RepID=UPI00355601D6